MVDLFSMLLRLYIIVVSIFFSVTKIHGSLVTLTLWCYDYLMHLQHWSLSVLFCFHIKLSKYVFRTSISLIYNIIMLDRLLLHKHAICFRNCVIVLKTPSFGVVSFNVNLWETSCQDCYILSLMNVMCVQLVILKKKIEFNDQKQFFFWSKIFLVVFIWWMESDKLSFFSTLYFIVLLY